jgi:hypothetical protein
LDRLFTTKKERKMQNKTITLYRIRQTEAYRADEIGKGWSFEPYGKNTDCYRGETLFSKEFELPKEARECTDFLGDKAYCIGDEIAHLSHSNARPVLITSAGIFPFKSIKKREDKNLATDLTK